MSKPKIQKENGLLLTLKELIDLGIIKSKRKRSKKGKKGKKGKKLIQESSNFVIKNDSNVKSTSDQMKGYVLNQPFSAFGNATTQIPNTDYRELRDRTDALNSRLIENRSNLETNAGKTNAFIEQAKQGYNYLLNYIPENNRFDILEEEKRPSYSGFDINDDIDVTETHGDDFFKPQVNYEPPAEASFTAFEASNPLQEEPRKSTRLSDFFGKRDVLKPPTREVKPKETVPLKETIPLKSTRLEDFFGSKQQKEVTPKQPPSFKNPTETTEIFNPLTQTRNFTPMTGIEADLSNSRERSNLFGSSYDKLV
jgi:hypothetical protein